jgi:hypothetical protein
MTEDLSGLIDLTQVSRVLVFELRMAPLFGRRALSTHFARPSAGTSSLNNANRQVVFQYFNFGVD